MESRHYGDSALITRTKHLITAPSKNPVLQPPHKRIDSPMRNPLIRFSLTLPAPPARSLARVSSATLATLGVSGGARELR